MIKETSTHFRTRGLGLSTLPERRPSAQQASKAEANTNGSVTISPEARRSSQPSNRLEGLLDGLESWGSHENRPQNASSASEAGQSNVGNWSEVLKSGQMPMGIIQQVFSTMKNAGGMATAGALHSLLSWGVAEKQKTGKIRPEFQNILHQAIELAKQNKNMSEEDLAKYEDRLFGGDDNAKPKGGAAKGGKGGNGLAPGLLAKIRSRLKS